MDSDSLFRDETLHSGTMSGEIMAGIQRIDTFEQFMTISWYWEIQNWHVFPKFSFQNSNTIITPTLWQFRSNVSYPLAFCTQYGPSRTPRKEITILIIGQGNFRALVPVSIWPRHKHIIHTGTCGFSSGYPQYRKKTWHGHKSGDLLKITRQYMCV